MKKNITNRFVTGLLVSFAFSLSHAQTAHVAGPVERVSSDSTHILVLGQTYVVDAGTRIVGAGKVPIRFSPTSALDVGSLVAVESESALAFARATTIVVTKSQYVPGATPVFVAGTVQEVSISLGKLRVGDLEVDISNIAPEIVSGIRVGSFVEIYGTQPVPNGLLIGQDASIESSLEFVTESIAGTGKHSIAGTGTQSIAGTGTQSIAGTGSF